MNEMSRVAVSPDTSISPGVPTGTSPNVAASGLVVPGGPGPTATLDPLFETRPVLGGSWPRLGPPAEAEVAGNAGITSLGDRGSASASAPTRGWLIDDVRWLTRHSTTIHIKGGIL